MVPKLSHLSQAIMLVCLFSAIYMTEQSIAYFFGDQTLAPILSILACVVLVFWGSPRLILVSIPLFAAETYFLIMDSSKYPMIRTSTMVVGGFLAFWACRQRKAIQAQLAEVDTILENIKTPWIFCDRSGTVIRLSEEAAAMVLTPSKDMRGTSFFSKFGGGPAKGELIRKFLSAADSRQAISNLFLAFSHDATRLVKASFVPVQSKFGIGVLAILNP